MLDEGGRKDAACLCNVIFTYKLYRVGKFWCGSCNTLRVSVVRAVYKHVPSRRHICVLKIVAVLINEATGRWVSVVSIAARLRPWRPRTYGSFLDKGKGFFSSRRPDWLWDPSI
jgi:hypothetical protein